MSVGIPTQKVQAHAVTRTIQLTIAYYPPKTNYYEDNSESYFRRIPSGFSDLKVLLREKKGFSRNYMPKKTLFWDAKSCRSPKGWFPKGWFLADVPPERKPERGYVRMFPRNEKPERGYIRMFPRNENRNEGTFTKTTLLRNRPFISGGNFYFGIFAS